MSFTPAKAQAYITGLSRVAPISKVSIKRLLLASLIFWIPVSIFLAIADEIREKDPIVGDSALLQYLHSFESTRLTDIVILLTNTSGPLQMVIVTAALVSVLFYLKRKHAAIYLLFSLGGAVAINVLLKTIFARERPDLWVSAVTEANYSFPSGHAMGSAALAFSLIILLWPTKYRWVALIIGSIYVLTIGLTRLYLGVHYPSDIVAGWSVSLVWVVLVKLVFDHFKQMQKFLNSSHAL